MANLPLISPVSITVVPLDEASTAYNARAREPVKGVSRGASVTFDAQHSQTRRQSRGYDRSGEEKSTTGYVITRQWMLDDESYVPKNGDKITVIGSRATAVYVTGTTDKGHLDGANTLVLIRYSSQQPRRT